jgi:hypothetical protein
MQSSSSADELHLHAHSRRRRVHAALQQRVDSEPRTQTDRIRAALCYSKRGGAGTHTQLRRRRQRIDDAVRNAVGQCFVCRKVQERKHSDRTGTLRVRRLSRSVSPSIQLGPAGEDRRLIAPGQAMDRKFPTSLPSLHRSDIAVQVGGDRLPSIKNVVRASRHTAEDGNRRQTALRTVSALASVPTAA